MRESLPFQCRVVFFSWTCAVRTHSLNTLPSDYFRLTGKVLASSCTRQPAIDMHWTKEPSEPTGFTHCLFIAIELLFTDAFTREKSTQAIINKTLENTPPPNWQVMAPIKEMTRGRVGYLRERKRDFSLVTCLETGTANKGTLCLYN